MGKIQSLLTLRLKSKNEKANKMTALAEKSNEGTLSSFSGIFRVSALNDEEKQAIFNILKKNKTKDNNIQQDLEVLTNITTEVKSITNQAIILHGERIQKAQTILKNYKEGAFSEWLMITYGNRQTPYNFLQYYKFYTFLPQELRKKMDKMPRQVIYTLASRNGDVESKKDIIKTYQGQTKKELLTLIRNRFPLDQDDKRVPNISKQIIKSLHNLKETIVNTVLCLDIEEEKKIFLLMDEIKNTIKNKS